MSRVEQRLYDIRKNPEQLVLLPKAYAAAESLRTAEEVELHLA